MSHPKIKYIKWIDEDIPDIIAIPLTMEDKKFRDLALDKIPIPTIQVIQYIDLSKLAGVRPWYPIDSESPSSTECLVDVEGMVDFVADVPVENMIEAWIYYKRWISNKK